jgi:hypothetical protein
MAVLTLLAILFSPVIAVCITLWWQDRKEKRDAKLRLFTTLMAQRKTTPPTYDWVQALNLIDVLFAKDERVVQLWHELYALFQNPQRTQTQDHKYIELLSEMASVLGFRKLQQTDIDKFYYPQSYIEALLAQNEAQAEWLRVLKNTEHFLAQPRPPGERRPLREGGPPAEPFERR